METSSFQQKAWPSARLRLALAAGFGGLLALMVIAGLQALRLAQQIHAQEEQVRESLMTRGRSLALLSSSIHVYNDRIQEYILSQNPEMEERAAEEFSELASQISAALQAYPGDRRPEEQMFLRNLRKLFVDQQDMLNPILSWSPDERRRKAVEFLDDEVLPHRGQIIQTSEEISVWNNRQLGEAERLLLSNFIELQGQETRLLIAVLAAGLMLSLASALYILRLERQGERRYQELARSRVELEELSARLVDAQETERRAISRELHDQVSQSLGALLVDVGRVSALLPAGNTQVKEYMDRIKSVAGQTVESVRDIALLLRPSMLDDLGLSAALEWQGREVSRRTEMEVDVQSENIPENLPDEYKTCIYRFVQEALNNAARHSGAKNATVRMSQEANRILVKVEDDGRGFDPKRQRGLGILGMEERIKRVGGALTIDSQPGKGTTLKADLPMPENTGANS